MRTGRFQLPRFAAALFRRDATKDASIRTGSCTEARTDYELLDERGDHLGTIRTTPSAPSFGAGAPTYLLTRLQRRAREFCARLRDRTTDNEE